MRLFRVLGALVVVPAVWIGGFAGAGYGAINPPPSASTDSAHCIDGMPDPDGSPNPPPCPVKIILDVPARVDMRIHYATRAGTAGADDFVPVEDEVVTIMEGELSGTIWLQIRADGVCEPDEVFYVAIFDPSDGTVEDGVGEITIVSTDCRR